MDRALPGVEVRQLMGPDLHVRAILRDGRQAFVGSQSLRRLELNARREVGIVVESGKVLRRLMSVFEADWSTGVPAEPLPAKERDDGLALQDPEVVAALEEVQGRGPGGVVAPENVVPATFTGPLPPQA